MRMRAWPLVLAATLSLGLAGCDRGAQGDPNARGTQPTPGATGKGTADPSARTASSLAGGMGASGATAVPDGSKNRTTKDSVGNR